MDGIQRCRRRLRHIALSRLNSDLAPRTNSWRYQVGRRYSDYLAAFQARAGGRGYDSGQKARAAVADSGSASLTRSIRKVRPSAKNLAARFCATEGPARIFR